MVASSFYRQLLAGLASLIISFSLFAEPANLSLLKNELIQYHDNGSYDKEINKVAQNALQYIEKRVAANARDTHPKNLAIVLDIDETCLSNYSKMVQYGFSMNQKQLHKAMLEANDPAIPAMLALFQEAENKGVNVFFVTGRPANELYATEKNLRNSGFKHWRGLYLRPVAYHESSIVPYKAGTRAEIAKRGYTIIASIGDQYSDLQGGFAEKTYKLPNPYYFLP